MPGYKKHLVIGSIVFIGLSILILYYSLMPITSLLIAAPLFLIYTLLPDCDCYNSKIRKYLEITFLIIIFSTILLYKNIIISIIPIVFIIIMKLSKHRGFFHSIKAGILLSIPLLMIDNILFIIALIGYITHLILDRILKN